jgi:hypothetical protein
MDDGASPRECVERHDLRDIAFNQAQIPDSKWFLRQCGQKIAVFVLGRL